MNRLVLFGFMIIMTSSFLHSSIYKGQIYFESKCIYCHGKAIDFVTLKSIEEWDEYLGNDGKLLYDMHEVSDDAVGAMEYFNGHRYKRSVRHLRDYFEEFSSDSGNIPVFD